MGSLLHRMTGDCKKTVRGVHLSALRTCHKTWRAALQMLLLWQSHNSLILRQLLLAASQSKVLSHLCQSFPLQAFGLGRSCLVTASCRRRPMVVKPTLTFRSAKKLYTAPCQPLNLFNGATQQRSRSVPALFTQYGSICQELWEDANSKQTSTLICQTKYKFFIRSAHGAKSAAIFKGLLKIFWCIATIFCSREAWGELKEKVAC